MVIDKLKSTSGSLLLNELLFDHSRVPLVRLRSLYGKKIDIYSLYRLILFDSTIFYIFSILIYALYPNLFLSIKKPCADQSAHGLFVVINLGSSASRRPSPTS